MTDTIDNDRIDFDEQVLYSSHPLSFVIEAPALADGDTFTKVIEGYVLKI